MNVDPVLKHTFGDYMDSQVVSLQREVELLESALQEQQQRLLTLQVQANQANELAKVSLTVRYMHYMERFCFNCYHQIKQSRARSRFNTVR